MIPVIIVHEAGDEVIPVIIVHKAGNEVLPVIIVHKAGDEVSLCQVEECVHDEDPSLVSPLDLVGVHPSQLRALHLPACLMYMYMLSRVE